MLSDLVRKRIFNKKKQPQQQQNDGKMVIHNKKKKKLNIQAQYDVLSNEKSNLTNSYG